MGRDFQLEWLGVEDAHTQHKLEKTSAVSGYEGLAMKALILAYFTWRASYRPMRAIGKCLDVEWLDQSRGVDASSMPLIAGRPCASGSLRRL